MSRYFRAIFDLSASTPTRQRSWYAAAACWSFRWSAAWSAPRSGTLATSFASWTCACSYKLTLADLRLQPDAQGVRYCASWSSGSRHWLGSSNTRISTTWSSIQDHALEDIENSDAPSFRAVRNEQAQPRDDHADVMLILSRQPLPIGYPARSKRACSRGHCHVQEAVTRVGVLAKY